MGRILVFAAAAVMLLSCDDSKDENWLELQHQLYSTVTECDGRTFGLVRTSGENSALEFKGFHFDGVVEELSKTDDVNGIEWKAVLQTKSYLWRWRDSNGWSDWKSGEDGFPYHVGSVRNSDGQGIYRVEKKNGVFVWNPLLPTKDEVRCESFYLRDSD